jgi:hypothetical protein
MRENRTSGTVQGAPGNRRSYCETGLLSPVFSAQIGTLFPFRILAPFQVPIYCHALSIQ